MASAVQLIRQQCFPLAELDLWRDAAAEAMFLDG